VAGDRGHYVVMCWVGGCVLFFVILSPLCWFRRGCVVHSVVLWLLLCCSLVGCHALWGFRVWWALFGGGLVLLAFVWRGWGAWGAVGSFFVFASAAFVGFRGVVCQWGGLRVFFGARVLCVVLFLVGCVMFVRGDF